MRMKLKMNVGTIRENNLYFRVCLSSRCQLTLKSKFLSLRVEEHRIQKKQPGNREIIPFVKLVGNMKGFP